MFFADSIAGARVILGKSVPLYELIKKTGKKRLLMRKKTKDISGSRVLTCPL